MPAVQAAWVVDAGRELIRISRAGLLGTAPVAPLIASILVVTVDASQFGLVQLSFGTAVVALFAAWAGVALVFAMLGMTDVRRANTNAFCELDTQYEGLKAVETTVCHDLGAENTCHKPSTSQKRAMTQFQGHLKAIDRGLHQGSWGRSVWVQGTGYLSLWQLVHRAEETQIEFEPWESVVVRAQYDRARMSGSNLPNLDMYRTAIEQVLQYNNGRKCPGTAQNGTVPQPPAEPAGGAISCERDARTTVATVRRALNEYADQSRAGLVRSRIQLACTTIAAGLMGYALLWVAMAANVPADQLRAAVVFYVVGALVSLVGRLRTDFGSETAIDDFGLSAMRHLTGPQLSGVAAVLGVGLLGLSGMTTGQTVSMEQFSHAFDVSLTPVNLVTAAVFGLTPGLLIGRLKAQSDDFKKNLHSTELQAGAG
jgi:hypothetical protein